MNKTESSYCDAPTVPEMQQTLPDPQFGEGLPGGFELKGYKFLHIVGKSYCSISYRAWEISRGSGEQVQVVVKEYYPVNLVSRNETGEVEPIASNKRAAFEEGKQHFLQEACFLMGLEHPSIVSVDSVFSANGSVYMVMPYESGKTLFEKLSREGRINQQDLLDLFFSISEALSLIHERGCLHRDLKPSNIFIREFGQPVILDFSAAIFVIQGTKACMPMISQGYTPIEQYSTNSSGQGFWTDIYALAAILYKGVTGLPPVDAVERGQKILKDLEDPYISLVSVASSQYSLRFLSAIDHALCFRAEDRPQDLTEWCAEFEGSVPVWLAADSVQKDLLHEAAKRSIDFDLSQ